jgi:hypothetical protein
MNLLTYFMDGLGNIAITFKQIADPYGVYKLAKAELDNNLRIRRMGQ